MKPIKGFPDYFITQSGKVYSSFRNKYLSPGNNGIGYLFVRLRKDGKFYTKYLHRLVAENYIDNPNNLPQVNHIDCDKANCNISNLEWVTEKQNMQHAVINGRLKNRYGRKNPLPF
jgi:hypothetical protein